MEGTRCNKMRVFTLVLFMQMLFSLTKAAVPTSALIWTQKGIDGVKVVGVPGQPEDWVDRGIPNKITYGSPADITTRRKSRRTALGFQYTSQHLFFSDTGFREIFKLHLRDNDSFTRSVSYNVSLDPIFAGISTKVRGLAVDWQAGNVYWTDMLYNWITVASANNYGIFRHIITTDLDKPLGIAVHPKKGYLFWTDQGSLPKVERSLLDGSERTTLVSTNNGKPTGIAVDFKEDKVYWLDDSRDDVIRMDLDGSNRLTIPLVDPTGSHHQYLYGIDIFKNYIIVTDQLMMSIKLYDKTSHRSRGKIPLSFTVPYDVMMYDSTLQEDFPSDCQTLGCSHMCVNMGSGVGRCICAQDYELSDDKKTCNESAVMSKPSYMYSIGSQICAANVYKANLDSGLHTASEGLHCFVTMANQDTHIEALAADVYGNLLFYSNAETGVIERIRLEDNHVIETHAVLTGHVRGLAVDWVSSNLYWADELKGHIMVSRLDGRVPRVIISGLDSPRGLVVDPQNGYMYWSTKNAIKRAGLDGSDVEDFVSTDIDNPDGMVINYQHSRLYWVDTSLHSIDSISLNGTDRQQIFQSDDKQFRDVTLYQDYIAWTDGENGVYFANLNTGNLEDIRTLSHVNERVSHDIITYDPSSQPLISGPCDVDNGGCNQLCLPNPEDKTCACTTGFKLDTDGATCTSDIAQDLFLIFTDPIHKLMYQMDPLSNSAKPAIHGLHLKASLLPTTLAYHKAEKVLYWYDEGVHIIKRKFLINPQTRQEGVFVILDSDTDVGSMEVDESEHVLLFTDTKSSSLKAGSFYNSGVTETVYDGPIVPTAFTINKQTGYMFWAERRSNGYAIYTSTYAMLPGKSLVKNNIDMRNLIGITVDSSSGRLYWWNATRLSSSDGLGKDIKTIGLENVESLLSVAAFNNILYYSENTKQSVMKYDVTTGTQSYYTDSVFSSITCIKAYMISNSNAPPFTPPTTTTTESPTTTKTHGSKPTGLPTGKSGKPNLETSTKIGAIQGNTAVAAGINVTVLAVAVSVSAVVIIVVIIVIVVLMRRRKNNKKQPPSVSYKPEVHDNPTYMRADEVPPRPVQTQTQLAEATCTDNYPVKNGLPFDEVPQTGESDAPGLPPRTETEGIPAMANGVTITAGAQNDTAHLIENMAAQSEVTLDVQGNSPIVSYNPDRIFQDDDNI